MYGKHKKNKERRKITSNLSTQKYYFNVIEISIFSFFF